MTIGGYLRRGEHLGAANPLADVAHGLITMIPLGPDLHVGSVQRQQESGEAQPDQSGRARILAVAATTGTHFAGDSIRKRSFETIQDTKDRKS